MKNLINKIKTWWNKEKMLLPENILLLDNDSDVKFSELRKELSLKPGDVILLPKDNEKE